MSVNIKVSYEWPEELQYILDKLSPDVEKVKAAREQKGRFKRAYIDIKDGVLPAVLDTEKGEKALKIR